MINIEWEKHDNKWFAKYKEFELCICEPIVETDTEFRGFARFYGQVISTNVEETKKEIFKLLQQLRKELNES